MVGATRLAVIDVECLVGELFLSTIVVSDGRDVKVNELTWQM